MTWTVLSSSPSFGRYPGAPLDLLRKAGCDVTLLPGGDRAALDAALPTADAWIAGFEPVDASTLEGLADIRVVAKCGAGLDNYDLDYLGGRGIATVSVPGGNCGAVAEYAIGQLLALSLGVAANDRSLRDGQWGPRVGRGLDGRTLAVVGFGRIGQRVAALASVFGMRVTATDPVMDDETVRAHGAEPTTLDDLPRGADAVSLAVPLKKGTRHLIGARELGLLPTHAVLVNCSRGGVVDEAALVEALTGGGADCAALDVFAQEPLPAGSPLLAAPNLLLSSHTAGYSDTALAAVTLECATKVLAALEATS